jgi:hypothetical protein
MVSPMPSYLEPEMISIVNCFLKDNYELESEESLVSSVFTDGQSSSRLDDNIVSSETYQERLNRLPRLTQMHLNIVALYLCDREKYDNIVKQYVSKFARSVPENDEA